MAISFDSIPTNLRTPGCYIEFNNELAGATGQSFKVLVIGQRLATGTQPAGVPVRVTDPSRASELFGRGALLTQMIATYLEVNSTIELWAVALDDEGAAQAATAEISVTQAPSAAGTLALYIGGIRVRVAVTASDDAAAVATAIAAAINADLDLPVTAAAAAGKVTLTARQKGELLNGLDLRTGYYNEPLPAGLSLTLAPLAGGTANPDITTALDALGDEWFNWLISPYTDTANMVALEAELESRYGPLRQIGARAFTAVAGTLGASGTFASARNSPHISCLPTGASPTPAYIACTINAAVAAAFLSIDPARPLQTLPLPGLLAPRQDQRWDQPERNIALYDGLSTYTVDRDGTCRIERQITMYQTNSAGLEDASYLDICTPETLERIRYRQRQMIAQKYPRHKLADDGTDYGPGQPIVTPSIIRGELLALFKELETIGWVEEYSAYDANLIVERDALDRNRLNWRDTPNLVNQARVFAGKQQYIL